jgi:hypothetical protein
MNESVFVTVKKETHSFVLRPLQIEQWRQQIRDVKSCSPKNVQEEDVKGLHPRPRHASDGRW